MHTPAEALSKSTPILAVAFEGTGGRSAGIALGFNHLGGGYCMVSNATLRARGSRSDPSRLLKKLDELRDAIGRFQVVVVSRAGSQLPRKKRSSRPSLADQRNQMQAAVENWAAQNSLPVTTIDPGTAKKRFTGNGNASADTLVDEADRRGFRLQYADEANALALLQWGLTTAGGDLIQ